MTWKEWAQTASVRQWAMILFTAPLGFLLIWALHSLMGFLEDKIFTSEQFYDLTKLQLQFIGFTCYALVFGVLLIVVALTLTRFSAVTKAGSLNVGGDEEDKQVVKVTTETKVEKQNGDGSSGG